ncbi:MAG: undecaprenyldiphospho-muramoylpentapeptide beta-N-acetylglucosaminyltransferase [Patescibacteria group bacterium]|nr:undecaprenyldiphospho-muramoylpentapeptide beta-N-acetylglucosaminyltransferase [Patescibacteria group bacterium]
MKIIFAGGGTGGSATPLLAVADEIGEKYPEADFLFIGTQYGPEGNLVREKGMGFQAISAGKLRRYFSWRNFIDPFRVLAGFFQSLKILKEYRPDVILAAGSFVSVPVVWAAWFLHIPALIHQQDVIPSLANKMLQRIATLITVTFESSLKNFPKEKTIWVGNPIREELLTGSRDAGQKDFGLDPSLPTVLVFGGGTGAQKINEMMMEMIFKLTKFCQVVHLFGKEKMMYKIKEERYHGYEFLVGEMKEAFAVADIVLCRAGLGSLTEVAAVGLPAIIIPMPDTHQEANAAVFKRANAAVVLDQSTVDPDFLVNVIHGLLSNMEWRRVLSKNIRQLVKPEAREILADKLLSLIKKPK